MKIRFRLPMPASGNGRQILRVCAARRSDGKATVLSPLSGSIMLLIALGDRRVCLSSRCPCLPSQRHHTPVSSTVYHDTASGRAFWVYINHIPRTLRVPPSTLSFSPSPSLSISITRLNLLIIYRSIYYSHICLFDFRNLFLSEKHKNLIENKHI